MFKYNTSRRNCSKLAALRNVRELITGMVTQTLPEMEEGATTGEPGVRRRLTVSTSTGKYGALMIPSSIHRSQLQPASRT